jgi:mannosyl-oligosaccharide glucosidase
MAKKGGKGRDGVAQQSGGSNVALIGGGVIALIAVAGYFLVGLSSSSAAIVASGSTAGSPLQLLPPDTFDALLLPSASGFPKEHLDKLLWGTWRPGVYFGTKSRSKPESLVAGLMWSSLIGDQEMNTDKLRHTCEEAHTRDDGLKFGYSQHDGSSFGRQEIKDPKNGIVMETSFAKDGAHDWVMSISGTAGDKKSVFYFYAGIDDEYADSQGKSSLTVDTNDQIVSGSLAGIGNYKLQLKGAKDTVVLATRTPIAKVKEALLGQLDHSKIASSHNADNTDSNVAFWQVVVPAGEQFRATLLYTSSLSASPGFSPSLSDEGALATELAARSKAFDERFEKTFGLKTKGYGEKEVEFAQAALSAMLGGLGYFYGASKVKGEGDARRIPVPLFASVPSRSFFPRGFMWDEGFHQLLIGRWDPTLRRDVLAHWLGLQRRKSEATPWESGWIPREQILGAEAEAKVPDWAVEQNPTHANPPTFLLVVEKMLLRLGKECADCPKDEQDQEMRWLVRMYPALEEWFQWYLKTQQGDDVRHADGNTYRSFRWRGRDPNDGKLNAMTLSCGLDDYPRASTVSDSERSVGALPSLEPSHLEVCNFELSRP